MAVNKNSDPSLDTQKSLWYFYIRNFVIDKNLKLK